MQIIEKSFFFDFLLCIKSKMVLNWQYTKI